MKNMEPNTIVIGDILMEVNIHSEEIFIINQKPS